MTTVKNPITRANPLPSVSPVRASTSYKSSFPIVQSLLPDILSTTVLQKHRSRKRVRFSLKLEPIEEDPSVSNDENSFATTTKPNKRIIDPWREDGPLYGAYIEYLEKQDILEKQHTLTPNNSEINQPSSSEPELDSSTYTHTFVIQSKSPDVFINTIAVSTPQFHLPRIVQRTTPIKKNNNNNNKNTKQSLPIVDPYLKHRTKPTTPSRHILSKRIPGSANNKTNSTSIYPTVKRIDLGIPSTKVLNSNEKLIQTDSFFSTKTINEHFPSKKLTEIITNPLPGTNNQINHLSERSILSNRPKTPQTSCHNPKNDELYFFQNHNNDHFQPIIYSTH